VEQAARAGIFYTCKPTRGFRWSMAQRELRTIAALSAFCCGLSFSAGAELFAAVFGAMGVFALIVARQPTA
jgi:hypothetical protein